MERHEVSNKLSLTAEQTERLVKLENMPDTEIDYSDMPESTEWSSSIKDPEVSVYNNTQNQLLESDVVKWLANQDLETKRHVNEVLRHIMALQKV